VYTTLVGQDTVVVDVALTTWDRLPLLAVKLAEGV
jgi:hypothetical protein